MSACGLTGASEEIITDNTRIMETTRDERIAELEREVAETREALEKAECFLATIVKGVNDPNFHAAKYWGGYKSFDHSKHGKKGKP